MATVRHIRQAISSDSLYEVLRQWCAEGEEASNWELRILSAFVSGGAIRAIEPLFDRFLAKGNRIEIIFGVDRGGTDRLAIKRLYALSRAYFSQISIRLFQAPARSSIFHPKLYILKMGTSYATVIGSSNLTLSGIGSNLESLVLCDDMERGDATLEAALSIWKSYAEPTPPLSSDFLKKLSKGLMCSLLAKLPRRSREDRGTVKKGAWEPLSRVPMPPRKQFKKGKGVSVAHGYMVYEIWHETRRTQMQIPLDVVETFFGVGRRKPAEIDVSIITAGSLSQPIRRPIIISQGKKGKRLMRRLEMPPIKGLKRPLIAIFIKLEQAKAYAYRLCPRGGKAHEALDKVLEDHGQQGNAQRRYYIGEVGDVQWADVSKLIGVSA